ncbi:unnamed protein product [Acanthoscelides obtectus]|uniref:Uncharacterized protein n=1 Tax=Acanthoscelides obtectus TaxID=200917 RepID=A0A9P0L2P3_ACAOB|nr:unnamed protein product [Acanthoscelides obtectus]CAK1649613.1 hypothetical protein AOBTE_LOCUS16331 [Acanthoscelides obtectus]
MGHRTCTGIIGARMVQPQTSGTSEANKVQPERSRANSDVQLEVRPLYD